jgi:Aspartyl protease
VLKSFKILLLLVVFNQFLYGNIDAIPFKVINNLIIIEIDFESKTGNFILDTGSDAVFLNSNHTSFAQKVTIFQTVNGIANSEETKIKYLKVGDITKENVSAFNTNLTNIENFLNLKIAGIIGAEFFNPHSIYLDFESNEIKFYKNAPELACFEFVNQIDFSMSRGVPSTEILIGNTAYTFILDSGASIHLIDSTVVAMNADLFERVSSDVIVESVGHSEIVKKYIIKSFSFDSAILKDHACLVKNFSDFNEKGKPQISGILSISKLSDKGIMIDFHRMKMYF